MEGSMQPQGHVQIIVNLIEFGVSSQEAGDAPRIRHGNSSQLNGHKMKVGGYVELETGFPYEMIRELLEMRHEIRCGLGRYEGYQAIMWDAVQKVYYGASESRKDDQPVGY